MHCSQLAIATSACNSIDRGLLSLRCQLSSHLRDNSRNCWAQSSGIFWAAVVADLQDRPIRCKYCCIQLLETQKEPPCSASNVAWPILQKMALIKMGMLLQLTGMPLSTLTARTNIRAHHARYIRKSLASEEMTHKVNGIPALGCQIEWHLQSPLAVYISCPASWVLQWYPHLHQPWPKHVCGFPAWTQLFG